MPLQDILPPAIQAYQAAQDRGQQQTAVGLQQYLSILAAKQRQQQMQQQTQMQPLELALKQMQVQQGQSQLGREQQVQQLLQNWGRMPQEERQAALRMLNPQEWAKNALAEDKGQLVGPGSAIYQGGKEVYKNPVADKDTRIQAEKLLDAAGVTDPKQRADYVMKILNKQATHAPGVNVYSPSLTPGIDPTGQPVFVQASGRPDVNPRVVPNVRPMQKATSSRTEQQTRQIIGEYEAADNIIGRMISALSTGGRLPLVGAPGTAAQTLETVAGTLNRKAPSPAIDLRSMKEQLIDKMKSIAIRKESNLSNKDVERIENILGFDKLLTTSGATTRALVNVQNDLRRRRMNLDVRPDAVQTQRQSAPKTGDIVEFNGAPWRFNGGNPAEQSNWTKVQ